MLDIKLIRENPQAVRERLLTRGTGSHVWFDSLLEHDQEYRTLNVELEKLRHQKRVESDEVGRFKREGKDVQDRLEKLKQLSDKEKEVAALVAIEETAIQDWLLQIPNLPHSSVPVGSGPESNKIVRSWGEPRRFSFGPRTHLELAQLLGVIDFERAAKIAGSHFVLFTGLGARLERALINFMLDLHTKEHGYTEMWPPLLVNRAAMTGTGQLPKFEEDMYRLKDDDLFLIPTAEVPVTNILAGEILEEKNLPRYYTAYTACFRREAGSYGKETKGLIRVHQFDKVELVKFVTPETSFDELEKLLQNAERVLQLLELSYRVVALSTGDLGFASCKTYDLETQAPGAEAWLEVSSCSNFSDFQARRANIRYREGQTKKVRFVHTLNGSGVALARTVIAILEQHQNADGSVTIPKALRPFLDGLTTLSPI